MVGSVLAVRLPLSAINSRSTRVPMLPWGTKWCCPPCLSRCVPPFFGTDYGMCLCCIAGDVAVVRHGLDDIGPRA